MSILIKDEIDVLRRVAKFLNTGDETLARELEMLLEEDSVQRNTAIVEELYEALLEEV